MATSAAVLYTLITVTGGGSVGHSRGYESLHMCEEAKSLATTGQTVEAYKAEDERAEKAEKEYREKFYAKHPPRPPRDEQERNYVKSSTEKGVVVDFGMSVWPGLYCGPPDNIKSETCGGMRATKGGLIQYTPQSFGGGMSESYNSDKGEWIATEHGRMVKKYPADVKTAECVIEPEAQK